MWGAAVRTTWRGILLGLLAAEAGCAKHAARTMVHHTVTDLSNLRVQGAEGLWAPGPDGLLLPLGEWVRVGEIVAFTYVDPHEGPSARWSEPPLVQIVRLDTEPAGLAVLDDAAIAAGGLPATPDWLPAYGPQPPRGTRWASWRDDPRLAGRLHPEYPDDLKVMIGDQVDGGFVHEVVWVSLRHCEGSRCTGALLNQPHQVPLRLGETLSLDLDGVPPEGFPAAVRPGATPSAEHLALAAEPPSHLRSLQDAVAWEVDSDAPKQDRLIPMSSWVLVGEELAFVHLAAMGPVATVFHPDGTQSDHPLLWRTRGMRVLTPEESAKLPISPLQDPEGQPPPGPWGAWRLDPAIAKHLVGDHPDVLDVHLIDPSVPGPTAEAEITAVRIVAHEQGKGVQARILAVPGQEPGLVSILEGMEVGGLLVAMRIVPAPVASPKP